MFKKVVANLMSHIKRNSRGLALSDRRNMDVQQRRCDDGGDFVTTTPSSSLFVLQNELSIGILLFG
jgi:hypothetical protein